MIVRLWKGIRYVLSGGLVWLACSNQLWAQHQPQETEEKGYVPVYIIIIALIGLALLVLLRANRRTTSFRRDDEE